MSGSSTGGRSPRIRIAPCRWSCRREPVPVELSRLDADDVVDILIDNVFAHTGEAVDFGVSVWLSEREVHLLVHDSGPGFAATAARRTGSTGLGLDIVRRTVATWGGRLVTSPDRTTGGERRSPAPAGAAIRWPPVGTAEAAAISPRRPSWSSSPSSSSSSSWSSSSSDGGLGRGASPCPSSTGSSAPS